MHNCLLVDIGSSTVKVYEYKEKKLQLIRSMTFHFRDNFSFENGISDSTKKDLFSFIISLKQVNPNIKIYATSIFRNMSEHTKKRFLDEFKEKTGIDFNIVSHDMENYYLERALVGNANLDEPVLLVNIGGGSTELVVIKNGVSIEKKNIEIGVGKVNMMFPGINENISNVKLDEILDFVKSKLPELSTPLNIAFYTGGELNFMRLASYNLTENILFSDNDHPSIISLSDMQKRNIEIFNDVELSFLESLMPENPKWMHGARGCSAIAQAIFEKYGIKTTIPSDSNMINGVIKDME